jgi:hypothetical protein
VRVQGEGVETWAPEPAWYFRTYCKVPGRAWGMEADSGPVFGSATYLLGGLGKIASTL